MGRPPGPRAFVVLAALLFCGVVFSWNSWRRDFWNPEEPRIAEVARTMEQTGDWIVPRICGDPFLHKPPLAYWLPAGLHRLVGHDPRWVYRLPFVAAAVAGLGLTYLLGRRFFDGRIAFLAVAIQATTVGYFIDASRLDDDLLFAVSVSLAITGFATLTRRGSSRGWAFAGWLGLAGCALAKSLFLGAGLIALTLVPFLFFETGVRGLRTLYRRGKSWPAIGLFLILAAPWYAYVAATHGPTLIEEHLGAQHWGRLLSAPDAKPPYFYLLMLVPAFFPWSLFIPLGVLHGKDRTVREGERLCTFWSVIMLVALSLLSSKKIGYLLVIWPPLALLIAAALFESREWFSVWEDYLREGVFKVVPVLMKVPLFIVLIAAAAYFGGRLGGIGGDRLEAVLADREAVIWTLVLLAGAAALVYAMAGRVRRLIQEKSYPRAAFELACAGALLLFAWTFLHDGRNLLESGRPAIERFASRIPAGSRAAIYGRKEPELPEILYYLARPPGECVHFGYPETVVGDDPRYVALSDYLRREERVFLITTRRELFGLQQQFASLVPFLHEVDAAPGGQGREYVLLTNIEAE